MGSANDGEWEPSIVRCVALRGEGVESLLARLEKHKSWLEGTDAGRGRKLRRLREAMRNQLRQALLEHAERELADAIEAAVLAVSRREADPYSAAEQLVAAFNRR